MRHVFVVIFALLVSGCAHYEYDIVAPADLARKIPTKDDTVVKIDPLEYRMQTMDNRLVMQIYNDTDDPFQLFGERSSIVDPQGQSHPLRGGPIPPHSFLKLIIPPPRPQVYDSSPTFGFGVGVGVGQVDPRTHRYVDYTDPMYTEPQYASVYDESDPRYWDWHGEGEARLTLIFQRAGSDKLIQQPFTFHRRKL